jgi:hypothetical protein
MYNKKDIALSFPLGQVGIGLLKVMHDYLKEQGVNDTEKMDELAELLDTHHLLVRLSTLPFTGGTTSE